MKVKVAKGRALRDPVNRQLLMKEGDEREVPANNYWLRRVRAGDVVRENEPKPEPGHTHGRSPGHAVAHSDARRGD